VISDDSLWHTLHPWTRISWIVINFQCLPFSVSALRSSIFTHSAKSERVRGGEYTGHKTKVVQRTQGKIQLPVAHVLRRPPALLIPCYTRSVRKSHLLPGTHRSVGAEQVRGAGASGSAPGEAAFRLTVFRSKSARTVETGCSLNLARNRSGHGPR